MHAEFCWWAEEKYIQIIIRQSGNAGADYKQGCGIGWSRRFLGGWSRSFENAGSRSLRGLGVVVGFSSWSVFFV